MSLEALLQQCTVKVTIPGRSGWGTGFFVAPGWILTCAHVVKEAGDRPLSIEWQGQTSFATAAVETALPDPFDLALLRFTPPTAPSLPCVYLGEAPKSRDPLYLFGYPDDEPDGAPAAFQCEGLTGATPPRIKFAQGQVRPGMSGSPLLNQRTGEVCGMVKFTRDRSSDLGGGAVTSQTILEQFPELESLQQQFHQQDRRWSDQMPSVADHITALLERIKMGAITEIDVLVLRQMLQAGSAQLTQLGKYNIQIGEGQDIHIGDRTYIEMNDQAVQAIIAAIQRQGAALPVTQKPQAMPNANAIFLSYRRSDSQDVTGRIYDRLAEHFGREVVFKDVDSIPLGVDFRTHLNQTVGQCQVLIAVIGPTWLEVLQQRLKDPIDWVREEITTALERGIRVIPLRVGGASLPDAGDLPETMKRLAYCNGTQARPDPDFHTDLDRLIRSLEEIVGSPEPIENLSSIHLDLPNTLTNTQFQTLQNTLINAFPDEEDLEMLVQFKLETALNRISKAKTHDKVVFDIIKRAMARNKVPELIKGALDLRPDDPGLLDFVSALGRGEG